MTTKAMKILVKSSGKKAQEKIPEKATVEQAAKRVIAAKKSAVIDTANGVVPVKKTAPAAPLDMEAKYQEDEAKKMARAARKAAIKKRSREMISEMGLEAISRVPFDDIVQNFCYSREELKSLVDMYYAMQELRKGADQRQLANRKNLDISADIRLVAVVGGYVSQVEEKISGMIKKWTDNDPLCQWATSIKGAGHLLVGRLRAHIDFNTCNCRGYDNLPRHKRPAHDCPGLHAASSLFKYAGLTDPEVIVWEKGKRRPFNQDVKQACWGLGESWAMLAPTNPDHLYCRLYLNKKAYYTRLNEEGAYREKVLAKLHEANRRGTELSDAHRACWESGKRQACGIDQMAKRYAVTIFMSHYFHVGQELRGRGPVEPYAMVHLGHAHYIPPVHYRNGKICLPKKVK